MIRFILIILFVIGFLVIRFVPWWITLSTGIVLILLGRYFAANLMLWLFSLPFRAKGKVLRHATVEVHSIRPVSAPLPEPVEDNRSTSPRRLLEDEDAKAVDSEWDSGESDEDEAEANIPRDYYEIEVTVTPKAATGPFFFWDYSDLSLVKPGNRWGEEDESCLVTKIDPVRPEVINQKRNDRNRDEQHDELEVVHDEDDDGDEDFDDGGCKVLGPRRLRMLIGVEKGVRQLVFNYYFENFGNLDLA